MLLVYAYGNYFAQYISSLPTLPHLKEIWFQHPYILKVSNYTPVYFHNTDGSRRGECVIYINKNITYIPLMLFYTLVSGNTDQHRC